MLSRLIRQSDTLTAISLLKATARVNITSTFSLDKRQRHNRSAAGDLTATALGHLVRKTEICRYISKVYLSKIGKLFKHGGKCII